MTGFFSLLVKVIYESIVDLVPRWAEPESGRATFCVDHVTERDIVFGHMPKTMATEGDLQSCAP